MVRRCALSFRKISSPPFQAYPFTAEEDEAFALQCGGPEMLKELEYYRQHQTDGVLRPISIGVRSLLFLRVFPLTHSRAPAPRIA
jgi:hypothetical protein